MNEENLKCNEEFDGDSVLFQATTFSSITRLVGMCPSTCVFFCFTLKCMYFFFTYF